MDVNNAFDAALALNAKLADREAEIARLVDERDRLKAQRNQALIWLADYNGNLVSELGDEWYD